MSSSSDSPRSGTKEDTLRAAESLDQNTSDDLPITELIRRLRSGLGQILALALLGAAVASIFTIVDFRTAAIASSTRVVFSFPGFEIGKYPDGSKFQPDDLRAPSIIGEALKRQGLSSSEEFQSKIRGSISVEGIVSPNIIRERDRLRANGQTPPLFIPDEYVVTLSVPKAIPLGAVERRRLLEEIVSDYNEFFQRTYAEIPRSFGNAFVALKEADYPEYQLILDQEVESIIGYLQQVTERAKSYRSPTTNLSFKDLTEETLLFEKLRLSETLGLIHENGLARDRRTAMIKMDYYLQTLGDRERRVVEEEKVITNLLTQSQNRAPNYVLGIKSQTAQPRSDLPVLDQGLVDSLLANDAYNFLLHRALDAGIEVKQVQAEKSQLLELKSNMQSFLKTGTADKSAIIDQVQLSLANLERNYNQLISNIRQTYADFAHQEYGDAIRFSSGIEEEHIAKTLIFSSAIGGLLGLAIGSGLSLLGIFISRHS